MTSYLFPFLGGPMANTARMLPEDTIRSGITIAVMNPTAARYELPLVPYDSIPTTEATRFNTKHYSCVRLIMTDELFKQMKKDTALTSLILRMHVAIDRRTGERISYWLACDDILYADRDEAYNLSLLNTLAADFLQLWAMDRVKVS